MVQWLGIYLAMQTMWVPSLVMELRSPAAEGNSPHVLQLLKPVCSGPHKPPLESLCPTTKEPRDTVKILHAATKT